jgi:hypothetical protein
MMGARIKRRRFSFALWLLVLLFTLPIVISFFRVIIHKKFSLFSGVLSVASTAIPNFEQDIRDWIGYVGDRDAFAVCNTVYVLQPPGISPLDKIKGFFSMPSRARPPYSLYIPLAWPLIISLSFATYLFWRPMGTTRPGHCQSCGYNLQGNMTGICPECGQTITLDNMKKKE